MSPKTFKGNPRLGTAIKNRRCELNLTIEEAAVKAGIGTKTWSRYESGESIRRDKVSGLCKALRWKGLPESDDANSEEKVDFNKYRESGVWSQYLEDCFGKYAAMSFAIGSDILLDEINADINALSEMPRGSHIGEVPSSFVSYIMPQQYLMRYDYEFMWEMRRILINYRAKAKYGHDMTAHSVIEELVLYLVLEESRDLMDEIDSDMDEYDHDYIDEDTTLIEEESENEDEYGYRDWDQWAFNMFDDMDIVTFLYDDLFTLTPSDTFHFDNWFEQQFYVSRKEASDYTNTEQKEMPF